MANFVTVTVDTSNLERRLLNYRKALQAELAARWSGVLEDCLLDIMTRTPSPDLEYQFIQGYRGGSFKGSGVNNPLVGHVGKGTHGSSLTKVGKANERIPFIRDPGMWLQELVMNPATYRVSAANLTIELGVVAELERLSRFSWQNATIRGGWSSVHKSEYGVWSFFEYGTRATKQVAKFPSSSSNGLGYKLKPYGTEPYFWETSKSYPQMRMYTGFNRIAFRASVLQIVQGVKF
jgi:hypothetical protein